MKASEDKLLEKLVNTVMKDAVAETPSFDFTNKVMSQVLITKKSAVFVYKPLISKSVFFFIFGCFILLFFYLSSNSETQTVSWVNHLNFLTVYNYDITSLFNFSKITLYSIVFATSLLIIQISFLKNHFNNQFNK